MTSLNGCFKILSPSLVHEIVNDPDFAGEKGTPIYRLERHTIQLYAPEGQKNFYRWIYQNCESLNR